MNFEEACKVVEGINRDGWKTSIARGTKTAALKHEQSGIKVSIDLILFEGIIILPSGKTSERNPISNENTEAFLNNIQSLMDEVEEMSD